MTPLEELLDAGRIGPEGVLALFRAVAAVARFDGYPPPSGHDRWDSSAVRDAAADFLLGQRATERLLQLALMATDDASFLRLLEAAVRNHFRSEARKTAAGKLYRRLRSILSSADVFREVENETFALEGHTVDSRVRGSIDSLIPAAWSVEISPSSGQLDVDGNVKVSRLALERMCIAVLAEAAAPLHLDQLLYVVGERLGLGEPPILADVDTPRFASSTKHPEEDALDTLSAEDVFEALSDRERLALIVLEDSVRDAARVVGIGKSSMAETMSRLRVKLDQLLPGDASRGPVLARLVEIAVTWAG